MIVCVTGLLANAGVMAAQPDTPAGYAESEQYYSLEAMLRGDDGDEYAPQDQLGAAVAIDGELAVVGAPYHDFAGADAGAAFVYRHSPSGWIEEARLVASNGRADDNFGRAVAISGDTIVVGAPQGDGAEVDSGVSYVFRRHAAGWGQVARLEAADGKRGDRFGLAVAVSGTTVMVGAPRDDHSGLVDAGAVFVFLEASSGWSQQAKVVATTVGEWYQFGAAVALDQDRAVVGEPYGNGAAAGSGSAWVLVHSGDSWSVEQQLMAQDSAAGDVFAAAVDLHESSIVVGAPQADALGDQSGAAYVFSLSAGIWSESAKLVASDGRAGDGFGRALSIAADTIMVGAEYNDSRGTDAGAAYVFVRDGDEWEPAAVVESPEPGRGDRFAAAVAIAGDVALVGVPFDDQHGANSGAAWLIEDIASSWYASAKLLGWGSAAADWVGTAVAVSGDTVIVGAQSDDLGSMADAGSAYVFVRQADEWILQAKLTASDAAAGMQFGIAVDIDDDTVVIGAWLDDDVAADSGAAYVFSRTGSSWTEQAKLTAPETGRSDFLGLGVAIAGDTVVAAVGGGSSVFVFRREGENWSREQWISVFQRPAYDLLNSSVALDGDTLVVAGRGDVSGRSAFIYTRSGGTWSFQERLTPSSGQDDDFFGDPVAISGDVIVVGAPLEDVDGVVNAGAVHVFERNGTSWPWSQRLQAESGQLEDIFGYGLDIEETRIVVGAPSSSHFGPQAGFVTVFENLHGTWQHQTTLTSPDTQPGEQYGYAVATQGESVVVGAWSSDRAVGTPDAGAAFVYRATASLPAGTSRTVRSRR